MTADLKVAGMTSIALACTAFGPDTVAVDAGRAVRSVASISESLKVPFIANQGQLDERVRFYARTFDNRDGTWSTPQNLELGVAGEMAYVSPGGLYRFLLTTAISTGSALNWSKP